ncbi:MAG: hypothetical protein CSA11_01870 [Chloroflexi bacterium]|nr:MAG: hypothetical protein CSA11_01870 [Chloroflexota bacterium]
MMTPAGKECRFYYQDFHRGHAVQECRLVKHNQKSEPWKPDDCRSCPVPGILLANSNPNLVLDARIKKGFMGFNRKLIVRAICSRHLIDVLEPHVGCPKCAAERPGFQDLFGEGL